MNTHTHCHAPHTLSNLKQLRARNLQKRKGGRGGGKCFNVSIFLFQEKGERGSIASRNCSWSEVLSCACMHIHTLAAPLCASKTSINARSKIYSSEKQQPKAFQGRQLGCRACGLTEEAYRLRLELTS